MDNIISIREDDFLSTGLRCACLIILPTFAFVQFFFNYSDNETISLLLSILIAVIVLVVAFLGFYSHYVFQYDSASNRYRKSLTLFNHNFGKWKSFNLSDGCQMLTFQKLSQTYETNFLNIYTSSTTEDVFVLRLILDGGKFQTLCETTEFESIPSCLLLGNFLSQKFNIVFKDYVKDLVKKLKRK